MLLCLRTQSKFIDVDLDDFLHDHDMDLLCTLHLKSPRNIIILHNNLGINAVHCHNSSLTSIFHSHLLLFVLLPIKYLFALLIIYG